MMSNPTTTQPENRQTEPLHRWLPAVDHNGNPWSPQQRDILNHAMATVENGDSLRLVIEAVAGSGKTTVLRGLLVGLAAAHAEGHVFSLCPMAFNRSIAKVLRSTMDPVKPDGADWVMPGSGTLSSHGMRTVTASFTHDFTMSDGKYPVLLGRVALADVLSDEDMHNLWLSTVPTTPNGNKRTRIAFQSGARWLGSLATSAMAAGLWTEGTQDRGAWATFLRLKAGSIRLPEQPLWVHALDDDSDVAELLFTTVGSIIDRGMALLQHPDMVVRPSATAVCYIVRGQYDTGTLTRCATMDDPALTEAGLLHTPATGGSSTGSASGATLTRYRTQGRFGHDRIAIDLPRLSSEHFSALNATLKAARFGRFGYANTNTADDRWSIAPEGATGWVRSVKDTPEDIAVFVAVVREATGLDLSADFGLAPAPATTAPISGKALMAFADQAYAPVRLGLSPWRTFDFILCDEVQDMSPLQATLMRSMLREGGSAVIVGDRRQSLYLFNGADSRAMTANAEALDATSMPMTVCFRQSATLAAEAGRLLGSLDGSRTLYADHTHPEYIPSWPVGTAPSVLNHEGLPHALERGDMVVCRVGAPLVPLAMATLARGIPVVLGGGGDALGDIRRLWADAQQPEARNVSDAVDAYMTALLVGGKIGDRRLNGLVRLPAFRGDEAAARADERYTRPEMASVALTALARMFMDTDTDLPFMVNGDNPRDWLASVFDGDDDAPTEQGANVVTFSTVHKAKGLEADRVFVVTDRMGEDGEGNSKPAPCFMLPWSMHTAAEAEQERNAVYVAVTRAKSFMAYVTCNGDNPWWMLDTTAPVAPTTDDDTDDDTPEPVAEDAVEAVPEPVDAPEAPEAADDDGEPVEAAPERQFACVRSCTDATCSCRDTYARDDVRCITADLVTDSPGEAQAWLAANTAESLDGYTGGQWLPSTAEDDVAVFALWLPCPEDVLDAVAALAAPEQPKVSGDLPSCPDCGSLRLFKVESEHGDDFDVWVCEDCDDDDGHDDDGHDDDDDDGGGGHEAVPEPVEPVEPEPVATNDGPALPEPITDRRRMDHDDRRAQVLGMLDALAASHAAEGNPGTVEAGTYSVDAAHLAAFCGCSVDTLKRLCDAEAERQGSQAVEEWCDNVGANQVCFDTNGLRSAVCDRNENGRYTRNGRFLFMRYTDDDEQPEDEQPDEPVEDEDLTPEPVEPVEDASEDEDTSEDEPEDRASEDEDEDEPVAALVLPATVEPLARDEPLTVERLRDAVHAAVVARGIDAMPTGRSRVGLPHALAFTVGVGAEEVAEALGVSERTLLKRFDALVEDAKEGSMGYSLLGLLTPHPRAPGALPWAWSAYGGPSGFTDEAIRGLAAATGALVPFPSDWPLVVSDPESVPPYMVNRRVMVGVAWAKEATYGNGFSKNWRTKEKATFTVRWDDETIAPTDSTFVCMCDSDAPSHYINDEAGRMALDGTLDKLHYIQRIGNPPKCYGCSSVMRLRSEGEVMGHTATCTVHQWERSTLDQERNAQWRALSHAERGGYGQSSPDIAWGLPEPKAFFNLRCNVCHAEADIEVKIVLPKDDASLIAEKPEDAPMVHHEQPVTFTPHYACTTCGRPQVKVGPCCGNAAFTWVPTAEDALVLSAEAADARVADAEARADEAEAALARIEDEKAAVEDERDTLKAQMEDLERGLRGLEQEMAAMEDALADARSTVEHEPPIETLMDDEPTGLPGVFKAEQPWEDDDRFDAA